MVDYVAPLDDMKFILRHGIDYDAITALPGLEEATDDLVDAVLEEAGKLAQGMIGPLNRAGDLEGARLENGRVILPEGWDTAYKALGDGGWHGLTHDPEEGGQGLPLVLGTLVNEIWAGANMAFSLCAMLSQGAIDAISRIGTEEQKATYLQPLLEGRWTGTMNLTEPQAGTDLGALRSRAERQPDGTYRIFGQKIFITYGQHEMTENIIHTVLARTPDAPPGVKGISMFIVPRFMVGADGKPGAANDLRAVSLEHKLGIHASPTAVMSYGDNEGAVGYLLGEENRGLEYMFIMMNRARHEVGLEGVAMSERAWQQARAYAGERVQGTPLGGKPGDPILHHPDVRRMLMTLKSHALATRSLAVLSGSWMDLAARHPDEATRRDAEAMVGLLTPLVKGWCTEIGQEMASISLQVHGGLGYIEETGAAQTLRDARITTIYEGTTGIQAQDLMFRKLLRDEGRTVRRLLDDMAAFGQTLEDGGDAAFAAMKRIHGQALDAARRASEGLLATGGQNPRAAAAASLPYLKMMGTLVSGDRLIRGAVAARRLLAEGIGDGEAMRARIAVAHFFAVHAMGALGGLADTIAAAGETLADDVAI